VEGFTKLEDGVRCWIKVSSISNFLPSIKRNIHCSTLLAILPYPFPNSRLTPAQTFTIGRGNEIVCLAITHLASRIHGRTLESLVENWGKTWRHLVNDSQLRWIGPEKGVIHLALGAVVNALWDLWAKVLGKPVWRIVADMSPAEIVDLVDFRYITDAITPAEALELLTKAQEGREERLQEALNSTAVPAYTTSAGWLGYGEDKMKALLEETLAKGYRHFKIKVGGDVETDRRRLGIAREVIGYDKGNVLMVDANQVWSVPEAIEYMEHLREYKMWFVEEPTSPDDGTYEVRLGGEIGRGWCGVGY
jgi:L-galactonate dehydratase